MDPHQGGDLSSMAKDGTSIPADAGKQNLIPSVPRPDQMDSSSYATDLAGAADNARDMPRGNRDTGLTGEVMTGTGDVLDGNVEAKRLHEGSRGPAAKGHGRDGRYGQQKESELERYAKDGAGLDDVPGDESVGGFKGRDERKM